MIDRATYNRHYYRDNKQELKIKRRRKFEHGKTATSQRKILVNFRLPEPTWAQLNRMANEGARLGKYPWKTMTEVLKGLLHLGLKAAAEQDPEDDSLVARVKELELQEELEELGRYQRQADITYVRARTAIDSALDLGEDTMALKTFHQVMETQRALPPNIWRDGLLAKMVDTYPQLAKLEDTHEAKYVSLRTSRTGKGQTMTRSTKPTAKKKAGRR